VEEKWLSFMVIPMVLVLHLGFCGAKNQQKKSSTRNQQLAPVEKERRRLIGKQINIPHFPAIKLNLVDIYRTL
jgi:hypothetical protein